MFDRQKTILELKAKLVSQEEEVCRILDGCRDAGRVRTQEERTRCKELRESNDSIFDQIKDTEALIKLDLAESKEVKSEIPGEKQTTQRSGYRSFFAG